jgi:hypothetical protein
VEGKARLAMKDPRPIYCPTCHADVSPWHVKTIYINRSTRAHAKNCSEAMTWPSKDRIITPLCPEGHEAYYVKMTKDECPICHTVPRYGKYTSNHTEYAGRKKISEFKGLDVEFDPETGRPFGQWHARPENAPCDSCAEEIQQLREFRAQVEEATKNLVVKEVDSSPSFSSFGHTTGWDVSKTFFAAVQAAGSPVAETDTATGLLPASERKDKSRGQKMRFRAEFVDAMQALYDAVNTWGEAIHDQALEHGRSLIIQLAEGRITAGQFDKGKIRYDNDQD